MSCSLRVFTDGGSRGNPGPAAVAFLIEDSDGLILAEYAALIGHDTSNGAEYNALIRGLQECLRHQPDHVLCISDSELLVRQLTRAYQVKSPKLKRLHEEASDLAARFHSVEYEHRSQPDDPGIASVDAAVTRILDRAVRRKRRSKGSRATGTANPDAMG